MSFQHAKTLIVFSTKQLQDEEVSSFFQSKISVHNNYKKFLSSDSDSMFYTRDTTYKEGYRYIFMFKNNFDLDSYQHPHKLFNSEILNDLVQINTPIGNINNSVITDNHKLGIVQILNSSNDFSKEFIGYGHEITMSKVMFRMYKGYIVASVVTPTESEYSKLKITVKMFKIISHKSIPIIEYPKNWFKPETTLSFNLKNKVYQIKSIPPIYKDVKQELNSIMNMTKTIQWFRVIRESDSKDRLEECNLFNILDAEYMAYTNETIIYPIHIISYVLKVSDICQCYVEGSAGGYFTRSFYDNSSSVHDIYNMTTIGNKYIRRVPDIIQDCKYLRTDTCPYPNSTTILYGLYEIVDYKSMGKLGEIYNSAKLSQLNLPKFWVNPKDISSVKLFLDRLLKGAEFIPDVVTLNLVISKNPLEIVLVEYIKSIALKKLNIHEDVDFPSIIPIPTYAPYKAAKDIWRYSGNWNTDATTSSIDWGEGEMLYWTEDDIRNAYLYRTNYKDPFTSILTKAAKIFYTNNITIPKKSLQISMLYGIFPKYAPRSIYINSKTYEPIKDFISVNNYKIVPLANIFKPILMETPVSLEFHRTFEYLFKFKSNQFRNTYILYMSPQEFKVLYNLYNNILKSKVNKEVVTKEYVKRRG